MRAFLSELKQRFLAPDALVRNRFDLFRKLLDHDRACHAALAAIEAIHYRGTAVDINRVRRLYDELAGEVRAMIEILHRLAPVHYRNLDDYFQKLEFYGRFAIAPPRNPIEPPYTHALTATHEDDRFVGGKGLRLSLLVTQCALPVPPGFVIATSAYHLLVAANDLRSWIDKALGEVDIDSQASLLHCAKTIADRIMVAAIPDAVADEVHRRLAELRRDHTGLLAVRSSAVAEDSEVSFAGQYQTLLRVAPEDLLQAWLKVVASKYTPEAIVYRIRHGLDDQAASMGVVVLGMVEAKMSGVLVTVDPVAPDSGRSRLHWVTGLGEQLMSGSVAPRSMTVGVSEAPEDAGGDGLPSEVAESLIVIGRRLARHFDAPQEIEWCIDPMNRLAILQSRDIPGRHEEGEDESFSPGEQELLFTGGRQAAGGVACGRVHRYVSLAALENIVPGAVLVCDTTPPELVRVLPCLAAVLVRGGSGADHFSSVAREFGVPVIVLLGDMLDRLSEGQAVTVWAEGTAVYSGMAPVPENHGRADRYRRTPVGRALAMLIDFISPLSLTDPAGDNFRPEGCRSLHDIIRFTHEQGMRAMFFSNPEKMLRKPQSRLLNSDLPIDIYLVDLGRGLADDGSAADRTIRAEQVLSRPFQALWAGLCDPGINWQRHSHYDWQSYDSVALAGGVAQKGDARLASYCLVAADYCNINLRFGYHFTLVDAFCGQGDEKNSILLRFAGGGGLAAGRALRLDFLRQVLERLGFFCEIEGDMLDGRFLGRDRETTLAKLTETGRLLGAVRLLDMVLKSEDEVIGAVQAFFAGRADFGKE